MRAIRATPSRTAVRRLAAARLISVLGGTASFTALMYTVFQLTGSPTWLSMSLLLTFGISGFAAPLGGAIGDRFDRKRVMVVSDLLGVACYAGLVVVRGPAALLGVAFVAALVQQPFWWASGAAIPNLVDREDDVPWANSLVALGRNAGIMVGPALGGFLVGVIGPSWVFGLNAVSFAVSAALIGSIRADFSGERSDAEEHRGMRAGFRFLARDRVLRTIVLAWVTLVTGAGLAMTADVPLAEKFGAGSLGYGLMIGAWGAGSVIGSLAGRRLTRRTEARALFIGVAVIGVTTGAIALSPWFAPILALALGAGLGESLAGVAEQGILQRRTPDAVRSRVMAASEAVITVGFTASLAVAGPALAAIGPQAVYAIAGGSALLGAAVLWPVLRGARRTAGVQDLAAPGVGFEHERELQLEVA